MKYEYVVYALLPLIIGALLPVIYRLIQRSNIKKEKKMDINNFTIHAPNFAIALAIFILIVFTTILVLLNVFTEVRLVVNIICTFIMIFVLFACYAFIREKTIVKNENILHIPVLGRKKAITFSDIKCINIKIQRGYIDYILIGENGIKIFAISSQFTGVGLFIDKIESLGIEIKSA